MAERAPTGLFISNVEMPLTPVIFIAVAPDLAPKTNGLRMDARINAVGSRVLMGQLGIPIQWRVQRLSSEHLVIEKILARTAPGVL